MAEKKYLDYAGLQKYNSKIEEKYAPLDSPALIGVPTAPTAPEGTKTTQIATTEFVADAIKTITSAYVYRGTVLNVGALPTVADETIGNVYNITEKSETTADFVEGAGHVVDAGANVAVAEVKVGVDYEPVTPVGDEDPSQEGWYESDGLVPPTYTPTSDASVQPGKTYYEQVDVLENKWDILGGWFDVTELEAEIAKRLEFGTTMPTGTVEEPLADGRTFLYLGETSYKYNPVLGITAITNPALLGYYEEDGSDYVVTSDTEPLKVYKAYSDGTDTYFVESAPPAVGDTVYTISGGVATDSGYTVTAVTGDDIEVNGATYTFAPQSNEYIPEKTYYTREEEYLQGVVYVWNATSQEWVAKTAGDTFVPITSAEIDVLFD